MIYADLHIQKKRCELIMKNSQKNREEIIGKIRDAIENRIRERNLKQKDILKLCEEKGYSISQSELSRILSHKMILGLYPAIALSDVLDIDMSAILYPNRWRKRKWDISPDNFIVDTENQAIRNFLGDYNMVFHSTDFQEDKILHGRLVLYPQNSEDGSCYCAALLSLDTGEKDDRGEEILKRYEGQFFVSPLGVAYCVLINNEWKELSLITFRHRTFYLKHVKCRIGLAMTISAGEKKEPVTHKLAICRSDYHMTEEQWERIVKQLRIQRNSDLYLSREDLKNEEIYTASPNAKVVLDSIISKVPQGEYYVVNREILKSINRWVSYDEIDEIISKLGEFMGEQYTMNLQEEDDRRLYDLLTKMIF